MPAAPSLTQRIPTFLLTGFLGSGKTTLLNRLLRAPRLAGTAVVVNEFGEVGLDQHVIAQVSENVVLLESGCLCCTLGNSLPETLADLQLRRARGAIPTFQRVVIETTGLADPAPIMNTLLGHRLVTDHYALHSVVVTADAEHILTQLTAQHETEKQLAVADRIVVTKADRVSPAQLAAAHAAIHTINSTAWVSHVNDVSTLFDLFCAPPARSPAVPQGERRYREINRAPHASDIRAHLLWMARPVSWERLAAWQHAMVERFGDRLLRVKGLARIADDDGIIYIQGVQRVFHNPERLAAWPDADPRGRIVCITRAVAETEFMQTSKLLAEE